MPIRLNSHSCQPFGVYESISARSSDNAAKLKTQQKVNASKYKLTMAKRGLDFDLLNSFHFLGNQKETKA